MPSPLSSGFESLPYFDEYLELVLRPRAEKALDNIARSLPESVWRHLIATLATEQAGGPSEAAAASIRALLERKLGLKIEVRLVHVFEPSDTGSLPAEPASEAPEVVTTPRVNMPLANAVASGSRPKR